ncbi:MAG: lysophospholipid acyltransferase family protein [Myxococcaceae bacterium]
MAELTTGQGTPAVEAEPMGVRLNRYWRIIATGICFMSFGVAGLWLLSIFPLLMLFIRDPKRRTRVSRDIVHGWFKFFIELMRVLGVLTYEIHGVEKLKRPGLFVLANHPSLVDVVFLLSLIPQASAVVRSNLLRNPFLRGPVMAARFVTNEEGMALVEDCRSHFEDKDTVVIFPQGTRTPENGEITFRRGAANVAIRCRQNITPVSIRCHPRGLARYQRWYQVAPRRMHFVIRVHDDLQVDPFLEPGGSEPLAVRRLNAHLEGFFEQESSRASA